jgi:hypothetical protein
MVWLLEANAAAALADQTPAELAERVDKLHAGDDRQTHAHAGIGKRRRLIPMAKGRSSSRSPSM